MNIEKYLAQYPSLKSKQIIITGANTGVGFELLKHIVSKEGEVIMFCRSLERANQAKDEVLKTYPDANIDIVEYDQGSLQSIKNAVDILINQYKDFDMIVFNAAVLGVGEEGLTSDGLPLTVGTNYVGLQYFINLLKPFLDASTKDRKIIFEGSLACAIKTPKDNIFETNRTSLTRYNISKKCVESLFYQLGKNNTNSKIKYLLAEPGATGTDITRHMNKFLKVGGYIFLKIFSHSPKKASLTAFRCLYEEENLMGYVPRGFLTISGYPRKYKYSLRRYKENYLNEGQLWLKNH